MVASCQSFPAVLATAQGWFCIHNLPFHGHVALHWLLVVIFLRQFWKIARKPVSCRLVFSCWCEHCQSKLRYIWCSNNLVSKDPLASIELNYCTSNGNPDGLWVPIILEMLLAYGLPPIRWTCKGLDSWAQRGPWSWNPDWGLQVSKLKYLEKSAWET